MFPKFTTEIVAVKIELLETNPNKSCYAEFYLVTDLMRHIWGDEMTPLYLFMWLQTGGDSSWDLTSMLSLAQILREGTEAGEHNGLQLGYS